MVQIILSTTGAGTWVAPGDCTSATIGLLGAGGSPGGGGAYAQYNTVPITAGASYSYQVGVAGGTQGNPASAAGTADSWFSVFNHYYAQGSGSGSNQLGGFTFTGSPFVPDIASKGGDQVNQPVNNGGSGGGAAGGPNGAGGRGGGSNTWPFSGPGGGGGANGGTQGADSAAGDGSSVGGNNRLGAGGGTASTGPTINGGNGSAGGGGGGGWANGGTTNGGTGSQDTIWGTFGPGGGGGGGGYPAGNGGNAGGRGAGGGAAHSGTNGLGTDGLIIITYTPIPASRPAKGVVYNRMFYIPSSVGPSPPNPNVAPNNVSLPIINQAIVGQVSTVTTGAWSGSMPITFNYQWYINGAAVPGATTSTYTPVTLDNSKTLTCLVTANNSAGTGTSTSGGVTVNSGSSGQPVNTVAPVIDRAYVDSVCTCNGGTWTGSGYILLSYQWQIAGVNVGLNTPTYMPAIGDNLKQLTCIVTAYNNNGASSPITSNSLTITNPTWTIVTDYTSLTAALASPPANGLIRMAAGSGYGGIDCNNKTFNPPIIVSGDPTIGATSGQYFDIYNTTGITLENWTSTGYNSSHFGIGIANATNATVTLNYVRSDNGTPLGSPTYGENGIQIRNMIGGNITIHGRCDYNSPDIWGGQGGISVNDCDATMNLNVIGMTVRNIRVDGFNVFSPGNVYVDRYLCSDIFWTTGDHPDVFAVDQGSTNNPATNVILTNSAGFQGSGNGSQNQFIPGYGVTVYTSVNNWVFQGGPQPFTNCTLGGVAQGLVDNNFFQGWDGNGGYVVVDFGSTNVTISNTTCQQIVASGAGSGYSQSNITTISQAASGTDYSTLDPWLAQPIHSMSRRRN